MRRWSGLSRPICWTILLPILCVFLLVLAVEYSSFFISELYGLYVCCSDPLMCFKSR